VKVVKDSEKIKMILLKHPLVFYEKDLITSKIYIYRYVPICGAIGK